MYSDCYKYICRNIYICITYLFLDVEDLYSEVIYCILHMIGNDAPDESMRFQFIEHLRKAFRVDSQKHILLYEKAASRDKPLVKLNLCVLEAKELACKDWLKSLTSSEELSKGDPFVTVRLKSKPFEVKNTTCKARSIHPVWKETFILGNFLYCLLYRYTLQKE